jgi:hypothetical protein
MINVEIKNFPCDIQMIITSYLPFDVSLFRFIEETNYNFKSKLLCQKTNQIFEHMVNYLHFHKSNKKNKKTFWESFMNKTFIIPRLPLTDYHNYKLGYTNKDKNKWCEMNIPNTSFMRAYWKHICIHYLQNDKDKNNFFQTCKQLVMSLPADSFLMCDNCHWMLPEYDFEEDDLLCLYCKYDSNKKFLFSLN